MPRNIRLVPWGNSKKKLYENDPYQNNKIAGICYEVMRTQLSWEFNLSKADVFFLLVLGYSYMK